MWTSVHFTIFSLEMPRLFAAPCVGRPAIPERRSPIVSRPIWIVLFLLVACGSPEAETPTPQPTPAVEAETVADPHADFVEQARASTNRLQLELKQELSAAMQAGGPAGAVEVCSERALVLTREVSERTGLDVRRVSVQHRNPANQATPGETSRAAHQARHTGRLVQLIHGRGMPAKPVSIACDLCHGGQRLLDDAQGQRVLAGGVVPQELLEVDQRSTVALARCGLTDHRDRRFLVQCANRAQP